MAHPDIERLRSIKTFPSLVKYLRDELDWPIESDDVEDLTFEYEAEELGIDPKTAANIQEIKQLRPMDTKQPWGIFFVKFEPKRLPVVVLRKILNQLVIKKRASAGKSTQAAWNLHDLLFISSYGEQEERQITFAHFTQDPAGKDLPTLKVLGWDGRDTALHVDKVVQTLKTNFRWPRTFNVDQVRERWSSAFEYRHREVITTASELAERLAVLASRIRGQVLTVMAYETEKGPIRQLHAAFRAALVHDLEPEGFADMYAQTIAYGLLSARIADPTKTTLDDFAAHMRTNPFLRELMETFLRIGGRKGKAGGPGIDFDELGVSEVVALLDEANMDAVIRDFGDKNRSEDPVMHFFEGFLSAYDAKAKKDRGVFYTPQPVVSYIVRSVHELLQTEFGLEDGLADTTTWGQMLRKHPGLKLPPLTDEPGEKRTISPDEPFVQILDPATGTATFLVEVIEVVHQTLQAKWKKQRLTDAQQLAAWNEYVPKHLLPRLHGYELMMAPYAIAHMKVGLKLAETGYRFGTEERARIYLTNALEPWLKQNPLIGFEALAHEATSVNEIKRYKPFTVLIGNPPYSAASHNPSTDHEGRLTHIGWLLRRYFQINGKSLNERNPRWLQDDYVKFIRFVESRIEHANVGVLGFITNHGYLANPTFRGLRHSLLQTFSNIFIIDLHGNSKRGERSPDGSTDENVFDIQQGVAIAIASRLNKIKEDIKILHADVHGLRPKKYQILKTQKGIQSVLIDPVGPFFIFEPQNVDLRAEFEKAIGLPSIFASSSVGIVTGRDALTLHYTSGDAVKTAKEFISMTPENARIHFNLGSDSRDWKVSLAQDDLKKQSISDDDCTTVSYRPFDFRYTFYSGRSRGFHCMPRGENMKNMLIPKALGLITARSNKSQNQDHFLCTKFISEAKCGESTTQSCLFPLYLNQNGVNLFNSTKPRHGFRHEFLLKLSQTLHLEQVSEDDIPCGMTAEIIFGYIYATLYSPCYRSRYSEFLKIDFPRLPLTGIPELFQALARLGDELIALHLMESPKLTQLITDFIGKPHPEVEKVSWSNNTVWLDKTKRIGFHGVPEDVWNFHIGGYQVCEKWLKDRKGRVLSEDDITHYQKIVVALSETIRLMAEIDEVIEAHGGWPGAFVTGE